MGNGDCAITQAGQSVVCAAPPSVAPRLSRIIRSILGIEWQPGELFPQAGFIVTNLTSRPQSVVHFYSQRETAGQWIKEGKYAVLLDPSVRPQLPCQPGSPATACLGLQPEQLPGAVAIAPEHEALDAHDVARQPGLDWVQSSVRRSLCDLPVGQGRGTASAIPRDPGPDSALREHLPEGRADMMGYRSRQPNESGRGAAGIVTNPGTNRLSGHSEGRFCFYSPSVVRQSSILNLHSPGEGWHNGRLGSRLCCRAGSIWEMSVNNIPER